MTWSTSSTAACSPSQEPGPTERMLRGERLPKPLPVGAVALLGLGERPRIENRLASNSVEPEVGLPVSPRDFGHTRNNSRVRMGVAGNLIFVLTA